MDCKKEEGLRAKQAAEKKMEMKDFCGALKIAMKAQLLYSELENISQMIAVCEIHSSADKNLYGGTDKDWYGILKIEPCADELSIKKQYRKLALILHPDKNKFSGSTDAFKLIGEAQRVLLDPEKRMIHDTKRRAFRNVSAPTRPSNPLTFWTLCVFCSVRYQFYRADVLNKVINCQSCNKYFTAFELNAQGTVAAAATQAQTQNTVPPNHSYKAKPVFEKKEPNMNRKRKKIVVDESSESSDTSENSDDSEEEEDLEETHSESDENGVPDQNNSDSQYFGEQPRRSSRAKRNVSYKENHVDVDNDDDDDDDTLSKQENKSDTSEAIDDSYEVKKEDIVNESCEGDDKENEDSEEEIEIETETFECPDPEFSDFDKDRKEDSFGVGQVWACYDTQDAMPRFYAYIKKVASSGGFKLQIQWLKPDPVSPDEKKWVQQDLPVSCGLFKREKNDNTENLFSFSHLVTWETTGQKVPGTFYITPKKGETWALFRNWSINWHSSTQPQPKYEYDFVEILSDDENGVGVSYLEKVNGFVCLFRPKEGQGGDTIIIGETEKYRFGHMVPSCRMSGTEREGVPKGSFELDPAALPSSTFENFN